MYAWRVEFFFSTEFAFTTRVSVISHVWIQNIGQRLGLLMTCSFKYQFDSEELVYFLGFVRGQCKAVLFATLKNLLQGAFTFLFSSKSPHISKFKCCGQELLFQMFFRFIHLAEQTKRPLVSDIFFRAKKA